MTLAINTTDAFATGTIANTGLGNRGNKSFSTGFQGQLIQISSKERQEIDFREAEAKRILLSQGIKEDFDGGPVGFPKTKVDFSRDKDGNLILQNNLPVKKEITSWYDVRHMIARNEFVPKLMNQLDQNGKIVLDAATGTPKQIPVLDAEGNPVMERKVSVQADLLEKSLVASARLKRARYY